MFGALVLFQVVVDKQSMELSEDLEREKREREGGRVCAVHVHVQYVYMCVKERKGVYVCV